jgi:hypothetical protein
MIEPAAAAAPEIIVIPNENAEEPVLMVADENAEAPAEPAVEAPAAEPADVLAEAVVVEDQRVLLNSKTSRQFSFIFVSAQFSKLVQIYEILLNPIFSRNYFSNMKLSFLRQSFFN